MSDRKIAEFPDVENKLQAPTKKSQFERQKAEAEAKRLREEAETKAVYEDFIKSFDDEEDEPSPTTGFGRDDGGNKFGGFSGAPGRRQFGSGQGLGPPTGPSSGRGFGGGFGGAPDRDRDRDRGRFGNGPGSLGPPPPSLAKRTYEGFQQRDRREDRGLLAFDDYELEERAPKRALNHDDDEYEGSREKGRESGSQAYIATCFTAARNLTCQY
jgi:U2-associated protein SR140